MTNEEVKGWRKEEIQFAINEMYARYGLAFRDEKTRQLFLPRLWYRPDASASMESIEQRFTDLERGNVRLLGSMRR